jgi:hypothetical protein
LFADKTWAKQVYEQLASHFVAGTEKTVFLTSRKLLVEQRL